MPSCLPPSSASACGLALGPDGAFYVGDRSGTVFRLERDGSARALATLPASVAAFHLAIGPDEGLYVTGPTLGSCDHVYRVDLRTAPSSGSTRVRAAPGADLRLAGHVVCRRGPGRNRAGSTGCSPTGPPNWPWPARRWSAWRSIRWAGWWSRRTRRLPAAGQPAAGLRRPAGRPVETYLLARPDRARQASRGTGFPHPPSGVPGCRLSPDRGLRVHQAEQRPAEARLTAISTESPCLPRMPSPRKP